MKSPKYLKHRPIVSVNDYDKIDAHYKDYTDVKALSIGFAQYDNTEISLKVWRHSEKRWSTQSEELPLHRNIDLNILLLATLLKDIKSNYPNSNLREEIDENDKVIDIIKYNNNHKEFLRPRLEELNSKLTEFLNKK